MSAETLALATPRPVDTRAQRVIAVFVRAPWACAFLVLVVVLSMLGPIIAPFDPQQLLDPVRLRSQPISRAHWLGTDPLSRDVFSRVLIGARTSLLMACSAALGSALLGTAIGLWSGVAGGVFDRVTMRTVDVLLSVPRVLLLLTVVGIWGAPSLAALIVLLTLTGWMGTARLVRNDAQTRRRLDHVVAAKALGQGAWGIARRHLLPAIVPQVAVATTTAVGQLLLLESGLSFLGVGVQPPAASWGTVLLDVSDVIGPARWLVLGPGLLLAATVVATHRMGDVLAEGGSSARRIDS